MSAGWYQCSGFTTRGAQCKNKVGTAGSTCGRCKGIPPLPAITKKHPDSTGRAAIKATHTYQTRYMDSLISDLLTSEPAVRIIGPRGIGKTTTARRVCRTYYDLSDPSVVDFIMGDPWQALGAQPVPVVLDEWRKAVDVLWRAKAVIDEANWRPGQFIVAGSIRREPSPGAAPAEWPLTARAYDIEMVPMSVHERRGTAAPMDPLPVRLQNLTNSPIKIRTQHEAPNLTEYIKLGLEGGYPNSPKGAVARTRFVNRIIDSVVHQDAPAGISRTKLNHFIRSLARNSSTSVTLARLAEVTDITQKTAIRYADIADNVGWTYELMCWSHSSMTSNLARRPKRLMADTALCAALSGVSHSAISRDPNLCGRFLETFVGAQLRAECARWPDRYELRHYRDQSKREVDFVIYDNETGAGTFVEVKVTRRPNSNSATHIRSIRQNLHNKGKNELFASGIVLHTGSSIRSLGDGVIAAPISVLWQDIK